MSFRLIGQERAVDLLQRSLKNGTHAHAYLFVGPAHVGKMALAINLAQALNCEDADAPCGQCPSCQRIASGIHADVQTIVLPEGDTAENESRTKISVDQIEALQHSANLPPFEGKYKVFIIDEADTFSIGAANRMLKTLEEPVARVVFILLTSNERRLPATVISRCQRVELLPLATAKIEAALSKNWGIDPTKATLLARLSRGCPGWAVSAATNDNLLQQRTERLDELMTIIGADYETRFDYVARWAASFQKKDSEQSNPASNTGRRLMQERLDMWTDWWRDLLLVKTGSGDTITNIDHLPWLTDLARNHSLAQIRAVINSIQAAGNQLRQNANPQLVLEVLMLSLPETGKQGSKKAATQFMVN